MTRISADEYKELVKKPKRGVTNAFGHFDSVIEYNRFTLLNDMLKKGVISGLERQVEFSFDLNGHHIGTYKCDFLFTLVATGERIVEDVKPVDKKAPSNSRRDVPLRLKMMKAFYGIDVKIITNMAIWPYSTLSRK